MCLTSSRQAFWLFERRREPVHQCYDVGSLLNLSKESCVRLLGCSDIQQPAAGRD